jgi:hypothetical protein
MSLGQALLPGARRAHVVDGEVRGDPADPGPERPGEVEAVEGPPGPHERLLGHVVRHVVGAHDPEGHPVHAALVAPHDLLEGRDIPLPRAGEEEQLVRPCAGLRGMRRVTHHLRE